MILLFQNNQQFDDEEGWSILETLLLHLKQVRLNSKIKNYLRSDSELMMVLVMKLFEFYSKLPTHLSLLEDHKAQDVFDSLKDEADRYLHKLDVAE